MFRISCHLVFCIYFLYPPPPFFFDDSEPDLEALYYLSDVRCIDKDDLLGFTLQFHFDDNPFFSNAVLTKRYDTANIMDQASR